MKHLILIVFSWLIAFSVAAEQYTPVNVTWDRPYMRTDDTQVKPDEPIIYMLWGTINAGQDDSERLLGAAIQGTTFIHLLDKNRTGLAGGTVNYRVKACDKYPPEGKPTEANCSESSNIEAIEITILKGTDLPPPDSVWAPFQKPYLNRAKHVEPPPGWKPPPQVPHPVHPHGNGEHAPHAPAETGIEGVLGF